MLEHRGTGRSSHICGRSVHNQRIERYWRDVYYGYASDLANKFTLMEHYGYLNIDNPKHVYLLHKIFLPRINSALQCFRNAWNLHPLSSERNRTPMQLMLISIPPEDYNMELSEIEVQETNYYCNTIDDLEYMNDSIVTPQPPEDVLTATENQRLELIDLGAASETFGVDIFVQATQCLDS